MPNMSYCRFENTFQDLRDCVNHWNESLSESEQRYKDQLIILCQAVAEDDEDEN
mgnify:CR=1 FL=1